MNPYYVPSIFVYSAETSTSSEKLSCSKCLVTRKNVCIVVHTAITVIEHSHDKQDFLPAEEENDIENSDLLYTSKGKLSQFITKA